MEVTTLSSSGGAPQPAAAAISDPMVTAFTGIGARSTASSLNSTEQPWARWTIWRNLRATTATSRQAIRTGL